MSDTSVAVDVASVPPSSSRAGQDGGVRISARADYAVRSILEIAADTPNLVKSESIAESQQIPAKFLEQILAELRRAGLVTSRRGAVGGYALARPAAEISVADVIRAVEGPLAWVRDSRPGSIEYEGNAESLAEVWVAVRSALRSVLDAVSIADVLSGNLPAAVTDQTERPGAWDD